MKKTTPMYILIKWPNISHKEKVLKAAKEKRCYMQMNTNKNNARLQKQRRPEQSGMTFLNTERKIKTLT